MEDELIVSSCPVGHFVRCERNECTHIMSISESNPEKIKMLATYEQLVIATLVYHHDGPSLVGHTFAPIIQNIGWKYCKLYKAEPITIEDIENQITF